MFGAIMAVSPNYYAGLIDLQIDLSEVNTALEENNYQKIIDSTQLFFQWFCIDYCNRGHTHNRYTVKIDHNTLVLKEHVSSDSLWQHINSVEKIRVHLISVESDHQSVLFMSGPDKVDMIVHDHDKAHAMFDESEQTRLQYECAQERDIQMEMWWPLDREHYETLYQPFIKMYLQSLGKSPTPRTIMIPLERDGNRLEKQFKMELYC